MILLIAESVGDAATGWPGVATALVLAVSGWVTLWITKRWEGRTVKGDVAEIKEQVTNGGTNLAAQVGEVLRRAGLMETYLRLLPSQSDITGLRTDIQGLTTRVDSLEKKDRRHYPDEP